MTAGKRGLGLSGRLRRAEKDGRPDRTGLERFREASVELPAYVKRLVTQKPVFLRMFAHRRAIEADTFYEVCRLARQGENAEGSRDLAPVRD